MPEITKISHGITIGDLKYGNAKPGVVEATLKPGETMEQALDELDERLNAWHRKRYPHLYQEPVNVVSQWQSQDHKQDVTTTYASNQPIIIDKSIERLEIAIENADTIEKLQKIKEENPVMTVGVNAQWNAKHEILKRYFNC